MKSNARSNEIEETYKFDMCPVGNKVRKNSAIKSNKNKNLRYRYGSMLVDIEETVIRLLGSGRNKIM